MHTLPQKKLYDYNSSLLSRACSAPGFVLSTLCILNSVLATILYTVGIFTFLRLKVKEVERSNLPKVTHLVNHRAGIWGQAYCVPNQGYIYGADCPYCVSFREGVIHLLWRSQGRLPGRVGMLTRHPVTLLWLLLLTHC